MRAHRSMCVEILKHRASTNTATNNNKRTSEHLVYMKHILMTEDDADDPCDAYFPVGKFFSVLLFLILPALADVL